MTNTYLITALFAAAFAQGAAAQGSNPPDEIAGSFQRMLAHEAYSGPTVLVADVMQPDPLEAFVHARLLAAQPARLAGSIADDDPIAASFQRLFAHVPYSGPTAVTVSRERDDLLLAAVHALRQGDRRSAERLLTAADHSPAFH